MRLNSQKELTPIKYDASGIKLVKPGYLTPHYSCFPMHWHERMELILITQGILHYQIRNHEEILIPGQLAIIPPEYAHSGIAGENGCTYETIMFDLSLFRNSLPITEQLLNPILEDKVAFSPTTFHSDIVALARSILEPSEQSCRHLARLGKIYELIAAIYENCLVEKIADNLSMEHIQPILTYINQHFCEDISSANLSQHFGYSEGYFCRLFKNITGLTPVNYIRILRLEKATKLIRSNKELSIGEIATQCGFSDSTYFARCFRSQYHMTPTEFAQKK